MPGEQFRWQRRSKSIEREHQAMRLAIDRLSAAVRADPSEPMGDVTLTDMRSASGHLEGTYVIRLFAEFETGLRLYWSAKRTTLPPSSTRDLLDGIAARQEIRLEILTNAQNVREYRNVLVHERDEAMIPITIADARSHLCRYFSLLPPSW